MSDQRKSYDLADTITALGLTLSANMRDVANAQTNKIQGILLDHQIGNKGRFDQLEEANARVLAAVEETARGLGKRIADVEEGQRLLFGRINDFGERLDEAEATLRDHNLSRDQSIAERAELEQGRQENAAAIAALGEEVQRMSAVLHRIEVRVLGTEAASDE